MNVRICCVASRVPSVILLSPSPPLPLSSLLHHLVKSLVVAITRCYLSSILPPVLFSSPFRRRGLPFLASASFYGEQPPSLPPISLRAWKLCTRRRRWLSRRTTGRFSSSLPCIPSETPFALHLQHRPGTDKTSAGSWRSLHRLDDRSRKRPWEVGKSRPETTTAKRSRCIPSRIHWSRFRLTNISADRREINRASATFICFGTLLFKVSRNEGS